MNVECRAWVNGEMEFPVMTNIWGNYAVFRDGCIYMALPTVPVMPFIGILDKQGNKIFAGDLVTYTYGRRTVQNVEVKWNDEICGWNPFCTPIDYDEIYIDKSTVEIVGNIYENPDLKEISEYKPWDNA